MADDIDWDEMVTVVLGAGTQNQIAYRLPRYMIFEAPPLSTFCDAEVGE